MAAYSSLTNLRLTYIWPSLKYSYGYDIQGVFITVAPLKSSKYKKLNRGQVRCIQNDLFRHKVILQHFRGAILKILQELRILSSVTITCQITKIVMSSCSQLSELSSVSQMSQVSRIVTSLSDCSLHFFLLHSFWSSHVSPSLRPSVSKVTSLLKSFSKCNQWLVICSKIKSGSVSHLVSE